MAPTLTQKLIGKLKGRPALSVVALVEGEEVIVIFANTVVVFVVVVAMLFVVEAVDMEVLGVVVTADVIDLEHMPTFPAPSTPTSSITSEQQEAL